MITRLNDSNDMNILASDTINSYIRDGYRIDAKESVIDLEKDKDCTFKAVLKKDVDGVQCKTIVTLHDSDGFSNANKLKLKTRTYHKLDLVDGVVWDEESRTFSYSHRGTSSNNEANKNNDDLHNSAGKIVLNVNGKKYEVSDLRDGQIKLDLVKSRNNRTDQRDNTQCFNRLSDVIRFADNNYSTNTCDKRCDDKIETNSVQTDDVYDDYIEDPLIKLVRYIYGKNL